MRGKLLVGVALLVAGTVAAPSSANADTTAGQGDDVGVQCTNAVDIGYTTWNPPTDTYVRGSGSWTRCDNSFTRIELILYKQVIGSIYKSIQIRNFNPADFGAHSASVAHSCGGNVRWYTEITAYNSAGDVIIRKKSNTILANCA